MMSFSLFCAPSIASDLTPHEIHIWCISLDQPAIPFHTLVETLSRDERTRADSFHFEKDRKRFIVSRGILRILLGNYLSMEPSRVRFCYGKNGKPALADIFDKGTICFNLSHSEGIVLYAFTKDHEIGIDIEWIHDIPEIDHIAEQYFSKKENAIFHTIPEGKKKEAFFNCWTRKEAFLKATGEGLSRSLDTFEVSITPGERATLISTTGDSREASRWSIHELDLGQGFAAALSVQGDGVQFKYKQMDMRFCSHDAKSGTASH